MGLKGSRPVWLTLRQAQGKLLLVPWFTTHPVWNNQELNEKVLAMRKTDLGI